MHESSSHFNGRSVLIYGSNSGCRIQSGKDAVSAIDNRMLAAFPLDAVASGSDLTTAVENFVNDRIGLRDKMILGYTLFNDRVFGKMVHPSYVYGKDGYVFGAGLSVDEQYGKFHEAFADMVKQIQDYCEARSIPFVFVFNPAKPAVLTEYIPAGTNYDRSWVNDFLRALDARGIRYIDNTVILQEKTEAGEVVFNQKYDANHWNDLGAFYGSNQILKELQTDLPTIHVFDKDELTISEELETSLPVSEFPIHELVPNISINMKYQSIASNYKSELALAPGFQSFGYYVNQERLDEGSPRALVFQGSYMNNYGYKYLIDGFGEYIHVHDYQNVLNFPYYFNLFQPDCVVFEVAEYTFTNYYFNYEGMKSICFNPNLKDVLSEAQNVEHEKLNANTLHVEQGDQLTQIVWSTSQKEDYGWLQLGKNTYDLFQTEVGYEVTVLTEDYLNFAQELELVVQTGEGSLCIYQIDG